MKTDFLRGVKNFVWPIHRNEVAKFFPMAFMLFFILFNYSVLRVLKDSLIIPAIGAESVTFIKSYVVVPCAILFALLYAKMTNLMSFNRIFFSIGFFYLIYFIIFALIIYPNQSFFHPSKESINLLIQKQYNLYFFTLNMEHLKWFLIVFSKWSFALNYVLAELWGSSMVFLLFWQFANQNTKTQEAKRFYPMFGLVGQSGGLCAGYVLTYLTDHSIKNYSFLGLHYQNNFPLYVMLVAIIAVILILIIFYYINYLAAEGKSYNTKVRDAASLKSKLSIKDSIKVVMSSKYIGFIAILIFSYGISINLVEGLWKDKARSLYPNTVDYARFSSEVIVYTGYSAMFFMFVGANILKYFGWLTAALITPITILITGICFFMLVVFADNFYVYISAMTILNPLFITVMFGTIQNVLSKGTKYALFESTKEMSYIPLDPELKSKGKAAVDVIGARFAKSAGAHVQSFVFILFPAATYTSIAPYLMVVFTLVMLVWLVDVKWLHNAYIKKIQKSEES